MVDIGSTAKRWTGSAWVNLTIAKRWTGSAWIDIAGFDGGGGPPPPPPGSPVVVNVSPGTATSAGGDGEPECPTHFSTPVTATASGGTGPYTYKWTRMSGSTQVFPTCDTCATTSFEANICFGTRSAVFRVRATDSLGAFDDSGDVSVVNI